MTRPVGRAYVARVHRARNQEHCDKQVPRGSGCRKELRIVGVIAGAVRYLSFADCETKHLVRRLRPQKPRRRASMAGVLRLDWARNPRALLERAALLLLFRKEGRQAALFGAQQHVERVRVTRSLRRPLFGRRPLSGGACRGGAERTPNRHSSSRHGVYEDSGFRALGTRHVARRRNRAHRALLARELNRLRAGGLSGDSVIVSASEAIGGARPGEPRLPAGSRKVREKSCSMGRSLSRKARWVLDRSAGVATSRTSTQSTLTQAATG